MVALKGNMHKAIPAGYAVYAYDFCSLEYHLCRWYLYPIFSLMERAKCKKVTFYHWLNEIGVMDTPEGCVMRLSDIWRKTKWL